MEGNIKDVLAYWMEGEITSFIKVWLSAYISLAYCYFSARILPAGAPRLAAFLPVVCLFFLLPLRLHSVHLSGTTGFFLSWLANLKLLMLAAGHGPLSDPSVSISVSRFIALACLPIKRRIPKSEEKIGDKSKSMVNYAVKALLFALLLQIYSYSAYVHSRVIMVIYCLHLYLSLELVLAIAAALARGLVGADLEPQFNEPYLSSSLQDFWGRRWNLPAARSLRLAVYQPVLGWAERAVGRRWATLPAVVCTFLVSGLLHELIYYYLGRARPTWEVTLFFLLHGVCLAVEISAKRSVGGRWRPPRAVGTIATLGFIMGTGFWLFFPQMLRCRADEKGLVEVAAVGAFVSDVTRAVKLTFNS